MDEKILIKSEHYSLKKFLIAVLAVSILAGLILSINSYLSDVESCENRIEREKLQHTRDITEAKIEYNNPNSYSCTHSSYTDHWENDDKMFYKAHPTFESFAECIGLNPNANYDINPYIEALGFYTFLPFFSPVITLNLISALIWLWLKSYSLTVTDKRVYGNIKFGKQVDLPVDSVSAVSTSWLKGISVATSSGKIAFLLIKNRDEIHKTLSDLIIARQSKAAQEKQNQPSIIQQSSNADELKKYKELLDSGVITQEEFDAKKKQILGL